MKGERSLTDDEVRMLTVDGVRIRKIQPNRDKRTPRGARRYVRKSGHHSLMLAACACSSQDQVGIPGGICILCEGAVLTGEEQSR